jgi:hypothetical protein
MWAPRVEVPTSPSASMSMGPADAGSIAFPGMPEGGLTSGEPKRIGTTYAAPRWRVLDDRTVADYVRVKCRDPDIIPCAGIL